LIATPKPPNVVLFWSSAGALDKTTLPGLAVTSVLVAAPIWKSLCEVSTKQPLVAAVASAKFWLVTLLSVTITGPAEPELKPALLAVMFGYVPAGMLVN